jgi:hypothetical protein
MLTFVTCSFQKDANLPVAGVQSKDDRQGGSKRLGDRWDGWSCTEVIDFMVNVQYQCDIMDLLTLPVLLHVPVPRME